MRWLVHPILTYIFRRLGNFLKIPVASRTEMSLSFSRLQGKAEEAGLSLSCSPATLSHTALAELSLNFTFSRVQ